MYPGDLLETCSPITRFGGGPNTSPDQAARFVENERSNAFWIQAVSSISMSTREHLTALKHLDTEEGRREYYTYDMSRAETLKRHVEPYLDPRYNQELLDAYGTDPHGDQLVRIVWAGTLPRVNYREDKNGNTEAYDGCKYPFMRIKDTIGYTYLDKHGKRVTVTKFHQVPDDALFTEEFRYYDLGVMKFVIEMKFTHAQMVQLGYYPKANTPDAGLRGAHITPRDKRYKRYRQAPNPNGEYMFVHYIETPEGEYRDVTQADIDQIHFIIRRAMGESEQEFLTRKVAEREALAKKEEEDKAMRDAAIAEAAIIRAEKKLARGKIIYGGNI